MIALCPGAVQHVRRHCAARLEVQHAKVGFRVVEVEGSATRKGEEHVASVGCQSGHHSRASAVFECAPDGVDGAELASRFIEGNTHDAVVQLIGLYRHEDRLGRAEVEPLAVGREGGEHLKVKAVGEALVLQDFLCLDVIDNEVRPQVIDFNLVLALSVEALVGGVAGEGDVSTRRMPDIVGAVPASTHGLDVNLLHFPVAHDDGAAVLSACMECEVAGTVVGKGMTVDAPSVVLGVHDDRFHVESCQVALVDAHPVPSFVAGRQQAVGYPGVDTVCRDADGEGFVGQTILVFVAPG